MGNRAELAAAMPAMLVHEGHWDGWYRHFAADGTLLDAHRTRTWCEFPDDGPFHYVQHNWLSWDDGRTATYEFGGTLRDGKLWWQTDRFAGFGWQTGLDVLMLKLDRLDVPDAHYVEMIVLGEGGRTRARTWQWFQHGVPLKWTLCNEERAG